jgi:hypothetical protein
MITKALSSIPGAKGTKNEIFNKVSEIFSVSLDNTESPIYKSLSQALSKHFGKDSLPEYALNTEDACFASFQIGKNPAMKQMLIAVLLQMPGHRGAIKDIKSALFN